jgi:hypothetical protein
MAIDQHCSLLRDPMPPQSREMHTLLRYGHRLERFISHTAFYEAWRTHTVGDKDSSFAIELFLALRLCSVPCRLRRRGDLTNVPALNLSAEPQLLVQSYFA